MEQIENTTVTLDKVDYRLTHKQRVFADAIVSGKSQFESIQLAGYKGKNQNVLSATASRLLKDVKIAEYVRLSKEKLDKKVQEKFEINLTERCNAYKKIIDDLTIIADDPDCDKRTKVSAHKAIKDAQDSLTRIAGLFNDKLRLIDDTEDMSKKDAVTLARISRGEVLPSQSN